MRWTIQVGMLAIALWLMPLQLECTDLVGCTGAIMQDPYFFKSLARNWFLLSKISSTDLFNALSKSHQIIHLISCTKKCHVHPAFIIWWFTRRGWRELQSVEWLPKLSTLSRKSIYGLMFLYRGLAAHQTKQYGHWQQSSSKHSCWSMRFSSSLLDHTSF
jgi:hypothetical protein